MLVKVFSGAVVGLEGILIEVEVDVASKGFPVFTVVGLPNKAIDEAKDRVRTALNNTSFEMPGSRLTINLAPANIPKEGSSFDLPMAIGILASSGKLSKKMFYNSLFIGELSLEGSLRPVPGVLPIILMARKQGLKNIFLPYENLKEASLVNGINIFPVKKLSELVFHLNRVNPISVAKSKNISTSKITDYEFDFSEIQGQYKAKRALEIAAAGFHNVHMKGVPGAGKTLLSRSFPSILPPMRREEILEVSKIYSVAGMLRDNKGYIKTRPFRSPHHTVSRVGLIGGGSKPRPGEISLAHRGVLFLDEFPEFPRSTLEALRQPLEDGVVTISRALGSLTFPARFLLIAASNPCPCGYLGHPTRACTCTPYEIARYRKKLSGPVLDRIDLHIIVPPVEQKDINKKTKAESSKDIRKRVIKARELQIRRFKNYRIKTNGEMRSADVKKYVKMTTDAESYLIKAFEKFSLSARGYFKVIKVAQTICDLESKNVINMSHISEALSFRNINT